MNGLLSKAFCKFPLIDGTCQCLSIMFLILGNILLKVSAKGKFPWVDVFSLFSNSIFRSTLMALSKWWSGILGWEHLLMKASLRSFKCLITSDVSEHQK